jgi:hypothetical protein
VVSGAARSVRRDREAPFLRSAMYRIPSQAEVRQRMLEAVRTSVEMLKGVAGFSVVRTERPGSAIGPHGGIQEDMALDKVLIRMRASRPDSYGGKLIIVCTKPEQEWRIARLSGVRGVAPTLVDDHVFTDEQEAQAEIFRMRLEQFPEEDGMPEHFDPAWKSPGGENWSP